MMWMVELNKHRDIFYRFAFFYFTLLRFIIDIQLKKADSIIINFKNEKILIYSNKLRC